MMLVSKGVVILALFVGAVCVTDAYGQYNPMQEGMRRQEEIEKMKKRYWPDQPKVKPAQPNLKPAQPNSGGNDYSWFVIAALLLVVGAIAKVVEMFWFGLKVLLGIPEYAELPCPCCRHLHRVDVLKMQRGKHVRCPASGSLVKCEDMLPGI